MEKIVIELKQSDFDGDLSKNNPLSVCNAIFIIKTDITRCLCQQNDANPVRELQMGENTVLEFQGGSLNLYYLVHDVITPLIIRGNNSFVNAPIYPIFKDTIMGEGFVNPIIYADWFSSSQDLAESDTMAINLAVKSGHGATIELCNREYFFYDSVILDKSNTTLLCRGTIVLKHDSNPAFIIKNHFISIDINIIKSDLIHGDNEDLSNISIYKGIAVKFTGNCYHCDININQARYLKNCFDISPGRNLDENYSLDYAGVQYCRFKFQNIFAYNSVLIDTVSGYQSVTNRWVTECKFSGGRLEGNNGIIYKKPNITDGVSFDESNGMLFENIGFENIVHPISLWNVNFSSFRDIRMAESIYSTYIKLELCRNLLFDIVGYIGDIMKGEEIIFVKEDIIECEHCNGIEIKRSFCAEFNGWNRLNVVNTEPDCLQGDDILLVSSSMGNSIFNLNWFIFDNSHPLPSNRTLSFTDLMVHQTDERQKFKSFTNMVNIILNNNSELIVDFSNSLYWLKPMLIINLTICDFTSNLRFIHSTNDKCAIGNPVLSASGTYHLSFDPYNEPVITKL